MNVPGEIIAADGSIRLNEGRESAELVVENAGDRPIQVGSHYHFAQANPALSFDRTVASGMRLDIPAGTSVRFEPGVSMTVTLVRLAGHRVVPGLRRTPPDSLRTEHSTNPQGPRNNDG